jgi:hypothetical protein
MPRCSLAFEIRHRPVLPNEGLMQRRPGALQRTASAYPARSQPLYLRADVLRLAHAPRWRNGCVQLKKKPQS